MELRYAVLLALALAAVVAALLSGGAEEEPLAATAPPPPAADPPFVRDEIRVVNEEAREDAVASRVELDPETEEPSEISELMKVIYGPPGPMSDIAMVEVMKIEGSERFVKRLLARGRYDLLEEHLFDWSDAHVEAKKILDESPAIPGLAEAVAELSEGRQSARELILDSIRDSTPGDLMHWLRIAYRLKPMPSELGACIVARLRRDGDLTARTIGRSLRVGKIDFGPLRADVVPALLERVPDAPDREFDALVFALGNLQATGPDVTRTLTDILPGGGRKAGVAYRVLGDLGPLVADAVPEIVRCAEENRCEKVAVNTLKKIGGPEAIPALCRWMHETTDRTLAGNCLVALIACDPKLESALVVGAVLEALQGRTPVTASTAISAALKLRSRPPAVDAALQEALTRRRR